jgi:hypothetical protein
MAEEAYRDYLAARVLAENKPVSCPSTAVLHYCSNTCQVTYRLLSRALTVDVSSAKRSVWHILSI